MEVLCCPIQHYPSFKEFLYDLGISGQQIKNQFTHKKLLTKELFKGDVCSIPIQLLNKNMISPQYFGEDISIVYESNLLLGLSKPIKIHSLPHQYNESDNLLSYIRKTNKYSEVLDLNKNSYERGLLFRLDYETSGLVLFAKDLEFFELFRKQIKKNKYYLAVVHGGIKDAFSYAHHISYLGKKGAIGKTSNEVRANAHLEGKKIYFNKEKNLSLVLIKLNEGLRHQIRIQLAASGFPIVGDSLYGKNIDNSRMFLHSYCYAFSYQEKNYQIFDENLLEFERILNFDRILQMAHQTILSF